MGEEKWCVVTGGRGFVARHLVEMLVQQETLKVRIADLAPAIKLDDYDYRTGILPSALKLGRAIYVSANVLNKPQVLKAVEGSDVVFHMAAPDSSINDYQLHYSVNVIGTKNVIEACIESNVTRLIYTSSASVIFDGINGVLDGDETLPYPSKLLDSYSATKAEGEMAILKANGSNGLLTCSLRPSNIFGPGDRLFIPSLAAAAKAGKSKYIIGDGNNVCDFTYVVNVAHSHLCADQVLSSNGETAQKASGQAYFITNMEPMKFWDFIAFICDGLGYERPRIKIPVSIMMPIAQVVERIYKLLGPYGMKVPQMIPSRVKLLSLNKSYSCSKAKELLNYTPIVQLQDGMKKTLESYEHLRAENQRLREGPSKASSVLGNGKVADILLWKNKKQTMIVLIVLVIFYFYFVATKATAISALSQLVLAASMLLWFHSILPRKMLGYNTEKIAESNFHLSEQSSYETAKYVVSSWNYVYGVFKSLGKGNDWNLFFKVSMILCVIRFLGSICFQKLYIIGVIIGFAAFFAYEQNEQLIDGMLVELMSKGNEIKHRIFRREVGSNKTE